MRLSRVLLGLVVVGAVAVAARELGPERLLRPRMRRFGEGEEEGFGDEEPILGYDGMDRDTLIDWLEDADLDEETLLRVRAYESAHMNRAPVLETLEDLLQ